MSRFRPLTLLLLILLLFISLLVPGLPPSPSLGAGQQDEALLDLGPRGARISRAAVGDSLTPASNATRREVVQNFLASRGMGADTASTLRVVGENRSPLGGVGHLTYRQEAGGLWVYGTYVKASVSDRGELLSVIENVADAPPAGVVRASIGARQALEAALGQHYPDKLGELLAQTAESRTDGVVTSFSKGDFFYREPTVTRVAVPLRGGALREGYLVETWTGDDNQLWHTLVGGSGRLLYQELRTNSDTYKIFPDHPGNSTQTVVTGPGGWVFSNTTTGNNVDAYLDADNNNAADSGGRPISATRDFTATADLSQSPGTTNNKMVAVQNLFYLNNVIHDYLYQHGFTEAAGNFQEDNFSKGGLGSDSVNAEAQDGGGTNNANFSTPADGSNPRMQMYLWDRTTPSRDGDLDSDIVWHEYGHGLTWRMIGSMTGPLAGAIGEGNSDVLAIVTNNNDVVGEYSYNSSVGIRRYRYTNYPLTYKSVAGSSVHNDGEIYAATMWHLWQLLQQEGVTRDQFFKYMLDGMNYTPARPAYEDMRDGILQAVTDPAHKCLVWKAFAKFGIGQGANGAESCNFLFCQVSVTESFAVPAEFSNCDGGTPPPTVINLTARGYKVKGAPRVDLTWSGAVGANVDVFRNGVKVTTTPNDGAHTDSPGKGAGTYVYKVCEAGGATNCSGEAAVTF